MLFRFILQSHFEYLLKGRISINLSTLKQPVKYISKRYIISNYLWVKIGIVDTNIIAIDNSINIQITVSCNLVSTRYTAVLYV